MILIIFCHPSRQSHNGRILERVEKVLKKKNQAYQVLDLYQEHFESQLSETEYSRIQNRVREWESDVLHHQKLIQEASHLIFIYPTWWYNMPATLKGYMDRVFTNGFAYKFFPTPKWMLLGASILSYIPGLRYLMQPISAQGFLKGKKGIIFRTYGGPSLGRRVFGNSAHKVLEQNILRFCGITDIRVHELYNVDKSKFTPEKEQKYLNQVEVICEKI